MKKRTILGERLRYVRRIRDLTQVDLARLAHMSPITISDLESGASQRTNTDTVVILAECLKVSTDYLLGVSDVQQF